MDVLHPMDEKKKQLFIFGILSEKGRFSIIF